MPVADDDWRLRGQELYLADAVLHRAEYHAPGSDWDHDHCEFCWATFSELDRPDFLHEGYTTEDDHHWVCPPCFEDLRERFMWSLREPA